MLPSENKGTRFDHAASNLSLCSLQLELFKKTVNLNVEKSIRLYSEIFERRSGNMAKAVEKELCFRVNNMLLPGPYYTDHVSSMFSNK